MHTSTFVVVNGCFDVLHAGHIRLLKYAKSLGGTLVVAIDGDERIRAAKGPSRPYNTAADRVAVLKAIRYVDQVLVFDTDEDLESIYRWFNPVSVKGIEYKDKPILGSEYCSEIKFIEKDNNSSTRLIDQMKSP